MSRLFRLIAPVAAGLAALGLTAAAAEHRDRRPPHCAIDHDHRVHHHDYYDHHPHDRYYRAQPYASGAGVTVRFGGPAYGAHYRDGRYYDGGRDYRRTRAHGGSRVVKRRVFDTRYRARIVLVEELFYSRRGRELVCTVSVRGPDARYVPWGRVRSIAARNCSYGAHIRYYA